MDNRELISHKSFLLKENTEAPIREMAKIAGDLKAAIEKVMDQNPELEGLALKKAIKGDAGVQSALERPGDVPDTLYDNQLNKFIGNHKGTRVLQQRGRKPLEKDTSTNASPFSMSSLASPSSDAAGEFEDDYDFPETEPTDSDIEPNIAHTPTSTSANNYKNIIIKKVGKIEQLNDPIDMAALKQFIRKPEVVAALGQETIRSLVSDVIR